jgi:hypothetical protein
MGTFIVILCLLYILYFWYQCCCKQQRPAVDDDTTHADVNNDNEPDNEPNQYQSIQVISDDDTLEFQPSDYEQRVMNRRLQTFRAHQRLHQPGTRYIVPTRENAADRALSAAYTRGKFRFNGVCVRKKEG